MRRAVDLAGREGRALRNGPAVVLGQCLADSAAPVGHDALADLAAGNRKLRDGHKEPAGRSATHLGMAPAPARGLCPGAACDTPPTDEALSRSHRQAPLL